MSERVLSIQSHVAYGYVGGKAAVFPLQILGYDVDVVNSVNFSNHSGYGKFGGYKSSPQDLAKILNHLRENDMLKQARLLTGYIPGSGALSVVADLAKELRERNRNLIYLLDPVMGDAGKLYVSPDVIPVYKSMLPLSTIITPNWFEAELLSDVKLTNVSSIREALRILHTKFKVPNVVISSLPITEELHSELPANIATSTLDNWTEEGRGPTGYILSIASSIEGASNAEGNVVSTVHALRVPKISGYYSGVGDLFSALVLGHYRPDSTIQTEGDPSYPSPLSLAVQQALWKTYTILKKTSLHAASEIIAEEEVNETDEELDKNEPVRVVKRMRTRELRLIQEQEVLRATQSNYPLQLWDCIWDN